MPKTKKSNKTAPTRKFKKLFDHLNHIRMVQSVDYFDTLDEGDKKSWDNYMICRFLSMQQDIIEWVNEIQKYLKLEPKYFYQLCIAIVPKQKAFFPYVKPTKKYPKKLIDVLVSYFDDSKRNIREYLDFIPHDEIVKIVKKHGYTDKEIDKMLSNDDDDEQ